MKASGGGVINKVAAIKRAAGTEQGRRQDCIQRQRYTVASRAGYEEP
ncbi:MAG TPA: hypothetical protein VMZ30_04820 [Pyrinomonadaceae bacterium]|nr:hypothetical protein [Pyrinomonadaceae bacterium]